MRRFLPLFIGLLLIQPAPAAPPSSASDNPSTHSDDQSKKKGTKKGKRPRGLAVKAMRMAIEDAKFQDVTFEEFTEWLGRFSKANVVVRWKVLEEAGVDRYTIIDLKLRDVTLRKLLQLVFDQVTGELEDVELAAKADDNTLIISTRKDLFSQLITKTYDVQSLLIVVPNFAGRTINDPATGRGRYAGPSLSGAGVEYGQGADEKTRQLIDTITSAIQPESWRINGGKGTIYFYRGQLVVRNNLEVHQILAGELKEP